MKKTLVLATAAIFGTLALGAQAAAPSFPVGYASPVYWINNAAVKQSLSVSGCKALKMPAKKTTLNNGNVTLFDDGTFVWVVDWSAQPQASYPADAVALTGQWTKLNPDTKSTKTFYLSINTASMTQLLTNLETVGLANCQTTNKPAMTQLDILDPSVLVAKKKNTIVVKIKNNIATGSLTVKGSAQSNPKGDATLTNGKVEMKLTMTGTLEEPEAP